jgi:hypothetical protein
MDVGIAKGAGKFQHPCRNPRLNQFLQLKITNLGRYARRRGSRDFD